jgi:hypothetical protein
MNIDEVQGLRFPEVEVVPEELLSPPLYARAIQSSHREYFSTQSAQAAGFSARISPPLAFFHTIDEEALISVLGIKYGRTMAVTTEYEFGTLATERDELVGQSFVQEAYRRTGKDGAIRQILVLATEFRRRESGEMVTRSRTTFLEMESL